MRAARKHPEIRRISSTLARDPEGHSRIPKETFQQVFDRMERDLTVKSVEWATIIEYFTKHGRPLSKEEIQKLVDEDRTMQEEEQENKRRAEEAERRRLARNVNEDDDDILQNMAKPTRRHDDSDEDGEDIDSDGSRRRSFASEDDAYGSYGDDFDEMSDDLERGDPIGSGLGRNRSAHALGRKTGLSNKRVTADDYIHQLRVKSQRKGRYGITVPQPFKFDTREKIRPKTTRERWLEKEIAEKQMTEQNMVTH